MFVRTQALLATSVAVLGVACSDPDLPTDLRPDGPPEVLTVLVNDDPNGVFETATFCKTQGPNDGAAGVGDPKRPALVDLPDAAGTFQLCPDDLTMGASEVTDALPTTWYVRVQFDELLDGNVEELVPVLDGSGQPTGNFSGTIKNTKPVKLTCGGVDVPYDGYYQPAGNAFSWPPGPSLFIQPDDPTSVPTGAECSVTINSVVVDKDGNQVPADQIGPYKFKIAPLTLTAVVPTPGVTDGSARDQVDPATAISLTFNDVIDPTSLTSADVNLFLAGSDCTGGTQIASGKIGFFQAGDGMGNVADPTSIEIYDLNSPNLNTTPADPAATGNLLQPSKTYRMEFTSSASISDIAGGSGAIAFPPDAMGNPVTELCFDTTAAM